MHQKFKDYVRDLNHLYKSHSEFWDLDDGGTGFSRIDTGGQDNIYSYIRTNRKGEELIVVCNFAPVPQSRYRIGVDENGVYKPVFDSNSQAYGGSGTAVRRVRTEKSGCGGRKFSIVLDLPPLSMMVLKAYQK